MNFNVLHEGLFGTHAQLILLCGVTCRYCGYSSHLITSGYLSFSHTKHRWFLYTDGIMYHVFLVLLNSLYQLFKGYCYRGGMFSSLWALIRTVIRVMPPGCYIFLIISHTSYKVLRSVCLLRSVIMRLPFCIFLLTYL